MNLQDIISRVQTLFGDTTGAQITTAEITAWANDAQLDIARHTEALQSVHTIDTVKDQHEYDYPSAVISVKRLEFKGKKLEKTSLEELDTSAQNRHSADVASGIPLYWYTWGSKFYLHPNPDKSETGALSLYSVRRPTSLLNYSDVSELPVEYHEDIVRYCLIRAKEKDEEFFQAKDLQQDYMMRMAQSKYDEQNRQSDAYPSIRTLPGDDY